MTLPVAALWPSELPSPQGDALTIHSPQRAQIEDVLSGPTRLRLRARLAPAEWQFSVWLTPGQMQLFETWYRALIDLTGGEFYARWIGGARLTAFVQPYTYEPIGRGWALSGRLVRTRTDDSICDAIIVAVFGELLIDDGVSLDVIEADLASTDFIVADDFPLSLIAREGC